MWEYNDPCNAFPTLFFDVAVDCFFIVSQLARVSPRASIWHCANA